MRDSRWTASQELHLVYRNAQRYGRVLELGRIRAIGQPVDQLVCKLLKGLAQVGSFTVAHLGNGRMYAPIIAPILKRFVRYAELVSGL